MDLPNTDIPDVKADNKSTPPNAMLKGAYNQLKVISVTSKLSHWDLRVKCEQDHYLQQYPKIEEDNMLEYHEEDHQFQEYCEEYNQQDCTETIKQEYTNLGTPNENIEMQNESIEESDTSDNFVHAIKQEYANLDTLNENIEVKNEIIEESDAYDNFVHAIKQEYTNLDTPNENIEVRNEIIEESDTSDNLVHVKEEITSDNEIGDDKKDINDVLHSETEQNRKDNFEVNIKVREEFRQSENTETESINNFNGSNKVLNHFENVDKVLKHFKKVDWISKNNEEVAMNNVTLVEELPTLKCKLCFKVFLGDDAYNEHMKKHTTNNNSPDEVKPSGVVLKVGDPVTDKCTLVKVKKIRVKRLVTDNSNEDNASKTKTIRIYSESAKNNSDSVQNNSDSSPNNNTDTSISKIDVGNDNRAVKGESSTAIEEENENLLIEIPGKAKTIKLGEKKKRGRYIKHLNIVYKKCDENCIDDKYCTQSKECRKRRRSKSEINTFGCEICDYSCKYKSGLDAHMLTQNRVKSFKCQVCGYGCIQQCHLDQHMRIHSRTKPYSCKYCDYNCVQRSQLDQHVRTHTHAKPFSCNICGYSCSQRSHLDQHMRRHTGVKPYSCIFCEYTCVQHTHLDQHIMKVHTNVHVFKCNQCKYRCLQQNQLAKHTLACHSLDSAELSS